MNNLPYHLKVKLPFLVAGFLAFLFSVYLYFVQEEEMIGIFVGLWVPSIHSLGTLVVTSVDNSGNEASAKSKVMS